MPYLGNPAQQRFSSPRAASVYSGDGSTTAFTLEEVVTTDEDILVSVDGVIQEPSVAYAVSSGTTLTFTAAPSTNSGNNIFVYYIARTFGSISMPDGQNVNAATGSFSGAVTAASTVAVTGDLTVDTDTLKVDSTNNRVGINTTTGPESLNIGGGGNLRFQTNDTVRIEYLNSTGAYALGTTGGAAIGFETPASGDDEIFFETHNGGVSHQERMRIDKDGHITMPHQTAFQAKPGAAQNNMAVGSEVTIVLGTEIFDNNADFASNSFTAPVTGKYRFDVSLRLGAVDQASEYYLTRLNTSNRNHDMIVDSNEFSSDLDYLAFTFSVLTDMDANDTATLKFYQNSGTAQTDVDQTNTRLSGNLVC